MTTRVLWSLCLMLGAMLSGIGVEMFFSGAGALSSYPLVVSGIALLPLAAAGISRLEGGAPAE